MYLRRISQTKFALGCDVSLTIVTNMADDEVDRCFQKLWLQVYIFERSFSRFLPKSELTTFNRTTGINIPISPEFKSLLISAKKLGQQTDGLYNPFIVPALQKAGYKKSAVPGYERDRQTDYTSRRVVGPDCITIGGNWAKIPYGTALDIGGCGKGYLADQLGRTLKDYDIQGYWLSLGGDILTKGSDENENNISLDIQSSTDPSRTTDWIIDCPTDGYAVATSGTFRSKGQNIQKNGHHIIDPSTQQPAKTDIRLATICADTALQADVLATCTVILGSKKASTFLKKNGIKTALLQCIGENGKSFEKIIGSNIHKINSAELAGVAQNA